MVKRLEYDVTTSPNKMDVLEFHFLRLELFLLNNLTFMNFEKLSSIFFLFSFYIFPFSRSS